jgi:hypothetical protein
MSGNRYLADTNAFIYFLEKREAILPLIDIPWSYSFITKIELLGKLGISVTEIALVKEILEICTELPHTASITDMAITLKQQYKIKTPDALIAATALQYNLPLLTADAGFTRIKELDLLLVEL